MGIRIAGGRPMLGLLAGLALLGGPARAETLGEVLAARGIAPAPRFAPLDQPLQAYQVLDDERDLVVVYVAKPPVEPLLQAVRFERASRRWTTAPLDWRVASDRPGLNALEPEWCRSGFVVDRFPGGYLLRTHINPSAECTVVLGADLSVRGVLAGWPVATLADGRLVYQRNQVHFASFHPVALALFDDRRGETALYPPRPARGMRRAHVDHLRGVYTTAWCNAHNHPCDPELFDEHLSSPVVADASGDALAFVAAWDNTVGWSDTERWGRLEPFRELRAALPAWDGASAPPDPLFRGLAAGLTRARNLAAGRHVTVALAGEPTLRDLVGAALGAPRAGGQDDRAWLLGLDRRWGEAATWRDLARAVAVPDEQTEVVYVYSGLRRPEAVRYRELLRSDFEARFGPGLPDRALAPDVRRAIFRPDVN
jgi:hypothetical protein